MSDTLYYYCAPETLLSLFENKCFWLTSLTQSNDALEGRWMLREWLSKFGSGKEERLQQIGARVLVDGVLDDNLSLGVCFSEDGDVLSQWRGYAANGSGFAVGFRRGKLEELTDEQVALSKIGYGYRDLEDVNEVIGTLAEAFIGDAQRFRGDPAQIVQASLDPTPEKLALQRRAAMALFRVKNDAFYEEREWRLHLFERPKEIPELKFRATAKGVSPYKEIKFPADAVCAIVLGPRNQTPESVVSALLEKSGLAATVSQSQASYR